MEWWMGAWIMDEMMDGWMERKQKRKPLGKPKLSKEVWGSKQANAQEGKKLKPNDEGKTEPKLEGKESKRCEWWMGGWKENRKGSL